MTADDERRRALAEIQRCGWILLADARLPSLTTIVAGEPIRGSWWGHAAGPRIYDVANALDDAEDVASFKLVEGKVCFVHRRLWPSLVAIGKAREPWQMDDGLDDAARALLERVEREGRVRASGPAAKALEARLLVASEQVHTEQGAHATELSSFARFVRDRGVRGVPRSVEKAKATIEVAVQTVAEPLGLRPRLPWAKRGAR